MSTASPNEPGTASCRRLLSFRRLSCLVLVICFVAFHSQFLQLAYGILVVDQPMDGCRYAMLMTPSPECLDRAAELLTQNSIERLLIVGQQPRRSVRVGALPSYRELAAKQLSDRGVSHENCREIGTQARTDQQMFRELDQELARDNANCLVISTATMSRRCRKVIDQALSAERSAHYRVHAVPQVASDDVNWWKSRSGVRRVLGHGLRLIFVVCNGESEFDLKDPYAHLLAVESSI